MTFTHVRWTTHVVLVIVHSSINLQVQYKYSTVYAVCKYCIPECERFRMSNEVGL